MGNGLLNLQTDLKSLRYGNDKPYVTKDIGQAPGSQIGREVQHRIDDTSRIAQMLLDKPGIKYLLHEAELQQVNIANKIKNRGDKTIAGVVLGQLASTLIGTAKIAASTLAQVPVNGTGTHFLKGFRTDTYLKDGVSHSAFASFFGAGGVEGAPLALQGKPIEGEVESNFGKKISPTEFEITRNSNFDYDDYLNSSIPADSKQGVTKEYAQQGKVILISGSKVETTMSPTSQLSLIKSLPNTGYDDTGVKQLNADPIKVYSANKPYEEVVGTKTLTFDEQTGQTLTRYFRQIKKESRINLGDQGARNDLNKATNKYWTVSESGDEVDKINYLAPVNEKVIGEVEGRDLIKFRFHIQTPASFKVLYFRAFLDSFDDNFSGIWNPVRYLGRAEELQVYGGFQRKISLSFKIAAATRSEMRPLYQKMMYLASATAPTYAVDKQFMQGTIIKVTVGDYIYELPGVLNNISFTWQTDYPWEIAMAEPENENSDQAMQELPMVLDCKLDFTPIHPFTPETGLKKYFTAGMEGKLNDYTKTNLADPLASKQSLFSSNINLGPEASALYNPESAITANT